VHLHVRNPKTGEGSRDPDLFLEMATRVRDNGVKAVMNITCGGGGVYRPDPADESRAGPGSDVAPAAERVRHIEMALPEMCSIDVTTQNQMDGDSEYIYLNSQATLRKMAKRFQELGVKPEIEVFAPGDILLANQMLADGFFDAPPMYQIVMGTKWGLPATPETLIYMRNLLPAGGLRNRPHADADGGAGRPARRQCARRARGQSLSQEGCVGHQRHARRLRPRDHRAPGL
jgi:uncharacterized protein (DUF849 family)